MINNKCLYRKFAQEVKVVNAIQTSKFLFLIRMYFEERICIKRHEVLENLF